MSDSKYIIDANILSYYIWGRLVGADKDSINPHSSIIVICNKSYLNKYICKSKQDNKILNEFEITEKEFDSFKHVADKYKCINSTCNLVFYENTVRKLNKSIKDVREICSKNKCYVTPEIPIAFSDGKIKNVFIQSMKNNIVIKPHENITFNNLLEEFFKETRAKVLLDRDMLDDSNKFSLLCRNIKRVVDDKYIYVDEKNEFFKVIYISDGKNFVKYDTKNNILVVNNKTIQLNDDILNKNKSLREILEVIKNAPKNLNKVHEAVKAIARIKYDKGELKVPSYYPEKSYVDSYLMEVAHDNVKVLTADYGIKKGMSPEAKPVERENIIEV